jgi:hypothetical protein
VPWRSAGVLITDGEGRYLDADASALELLGVPSVDALRATPPSTFQPAPPDPEEERAFREAFAQASVDGLIGEGAIRRLDGVLVRVRTAIIAEPAGGYRVLLYPVEWPTSNLAPRVYRIADVLAEWRSAERRMVGLDPDSEEARQVAADVDLLREQYQLMFKQSFGGRH